MDSEQIPADLRPHIVTAGQDFIAGLQRWDIFARLGWFEVKRRYRRTILGPFWGTANLAVFILAMGTVGGGIFGRQLAEYLPFLATGMIVWVFLSTMISESSSLFIATQNLYRQMQFNYSTLAYALVWRNLIVFLHNAIPYLIVVLLFVPHFITLRTLLIFPGLVIIILNGIWIALFLGTTCLRFRDLQQLVTTFIQIGLFITPILWPPDSLQGIRHLVFVDLNPLYSLMEVVRAPLLGQAPSMRVYGTVLLITIVGWTITFIVFSYFRKRISYWA
jgi:homopolymeric O-antigen transport system permease protein